MSILGKEGLSQADWVLLDTAEVIVHLFRPEVREFYALERMWDSAAPTDEIVHVHADLADTGIWSYEADDIDDRQSPQKP